MLPVCVLLCSLMFSYVLVLLLKVLESLQAMWECTEDPQLLCRILEGIWDYASVCAALNMLDLFDR